MRDERNNAGKIIVLLLIVIVALIGVIAYTLVLKPMFTGYVVEKQTEVFGTLISQVQQTGFVQLTNADEQGNVIVCQQVQTQAS